MGVHGARGPEKLEALIEQQPKLFEQFKKTGEQDTDHAHARQPRLRAGLLPGIYRPPEGVQPQPRPGGFHDAGGGREEDLDRARPAARRAQPHARLRQPARPARGLFHHDRHSRHGGQALGVRAGQLAQGRAGGHAHHGDPDVDHLQLLLSGDGPAVAAGLRCLSCCCSGSAPSWCSAGSWKRSA